MRLLLVSLLLAAACLAQDTNGSIVGTVQDPSGAGVPGATVTITAAERTAVLRVAKTDSDGNYSAPLLPEGLYSVTVESKGFKKSIQKDIRLNVADKLTVNVRLEIGDIAQEVTVEAAPVVVELQSPVQSTTISGSQIRELALITRNYEQLVALMPGVSSANVDQLYVGVTLPSGATATIPFAINGARNSANSWTVDGADNVDRGSNQTLVNTPSIDSIAEFKVERSNYTAETGRAGGGNISVVTKSGTSKFHGNLFEFVRNSSLAANNFLNNANRVNLGSDGTAKVAPLHYNNFGFTLGGPVLLPGYNKARNKTFFFYSQEFRRVITYATGVGTLPLSGWLTGSFGHPVCASYTGTTCNTATQQITTIDPIAKQYIQDIFSKLPLSATSTTSTNLFRNVYNFEQEAVKIDHYFNEKHRATFRFLRDDIPTIEPQGLFTGFAVPGVPITSTNSPGHNYIGRFTSTLKPPWLNEAGFNYSYGAIVSDPIGLIAKTNSPDIKPNLPFPVTLNQVPALTFRGGPTIQSFGPYRDFNRNYTFFDNMTKIFGAHALKFGFVYNHYQKTENAGGGNQASFGFVSSAATIPPGGGTTFEQSFANFLPGNVANFSQTSIDITPDIQSHQTEMYVQDDWRVKPNLTVNLGVRYSLFRQPVDKNHLLTTFDPSLYNPSAAPAFTAAVLLAKQDALKSPNGISINGQSSPYGDKISRESNKNFGPRIGLAWDPFKKGRTSIRAGYGISYDATLFGTYEQNIFANPPFVNVASIPNTSLSNPGGGAATVANSPKVLRGTTASMNTPYTQQWSFDIEQQFGTSTLLRVAYVGTKGTHLLGITDENTIQPNLAFTSGLVPSSTVFTSANEPLLNKIRPYLGYNAINVVEPWFNSNYNALQVQLTKRFHGESQVSAAYTWSKNMTDNGSDRSNAPQNFYNRALDYAPAPFDRKSIFTANGIYELPFYRDQNGAIGKTLGGWQVSAITYFNTGLPLTVTTTGTDFAALGILGSSQAGFRPDNVCDPTQGFTQSRFQYFNTGCFQNIPSTDHRLGTSGRSVVRGPGLERLDMSIAKNLSFGPEGRFRFQLRGEATNVFNHSNPSGLAIALSAPSTFGTITSYRDPRIFQLGAKFYF